PHEVAALMHGIISNPDRQEEILLTQDAALDRLLAPDFACTVVTLVRGILDGPRAAAPRVAPDFWRQFTLAEELEVIRQSRPAAFRATPFEPAYRGPVADLGHGR